RAILIAHELAVLVDVQLNLVAAADAVVAHAVLRLVELQPVLVLADVDAGRVWILRRASLRTRDLPAPTQLVVAAGPAVRRRGRRRIWARRGRGVGRWRGPRRRRAGPGVGARAGGAR